MKHFYLGALLLPLLAGLALADPAPVTVREEPVVLPTYQIGPADLNAIYFTGRVYQGAQGHTYPYAMLDRLTDDKKDVTYKGLFLENEFVKICVMPELGGRILQATDKTNKYEFFYRQHVVKPALIGMLGAWMSGGVEWNIPHHHRPSSFMAVDWKTIENPDGSKSIWVGETELRHRMKWSVELSVVPGRSYVKAKTRIENRSNLIQSMLCWANVSVHCNPDYEVIFAPNVQHGCDHAKVSFCEWPEGLPGVDFRYWKNHTDRFRSVFAWDQESDFLAGYDHGRDAGTVHIANHYQVPGKKFFLWGNHDRAKMWDKMLTDPWTDEEKKESLEGSDAEYPQYLELMVGAWSDNQPDYSWIGPGETREHTQVWYPIRGIGGVKAATVDAAANMERFAEDKIRFGFCATGDFRNAKSVIYINGEEALEKEINIDPAHPFIQELTVPKETKDEEIRVALLDASGKVLVTWQPTRLEPEEMPEIVKPTPAPKDFQTVEELFLAAQRMEQFHNARMNPMDYYEEALRRDPGDARTNTAVGLHYARQAKWELAGKHLRAALARLDKNYTRLKDGEPHYLLGLVLQNEGKIAEAKDQYWKATWTTGYQSAAFFQLAKLASCEGDYPKALELVLKSLNSNYDDPKAQVVRAYFLRKMNAPREVRLAVLMNVLRQNPLDVMAKVELALAEGFFDARANAIFDEALRGDDLVKVQELLEVVADYASLGSDDAARILRAAMRYGKPFSDSLLAAYWLDALAPGEGVKVPAQSLDYCFPFRVEEIALLQAAVKRNPNDAKAWCLLGNILYYFEQKDAGIAAWEKSAQLNPAYGRVWRNLGFAYTQAGQIDRAIEAYKTSLKYDVSDPKPFVELDVLEAQKLVPAPERLKLMEANLETVLSHDDSTIRLIGLWNATGQYQKAIDQLDKRHFHVWEGGRAVHDTFVDAHLLRGLARRDAKDFDGAVADFEIAQTYPENLEVGRVVGGGQNAKIFYFLGTTLEAKGDVEGAKKAFTQSADPANANVDLCHEITYFQIASLKKLGRSDEAKALTQKFADAVNARMDRSARADEFSKFGEDGTAAERSAKLFFLHGLVSLAQDDAPAAKNFFDEALKLNPNLIWPKVMK